MAKRDEIVNFLATELAFAQFKDVGLNGLQIEGANEVHTVAVAVDAAQTTIDKAIECGAQMLIVHHGIFWREPAAISGAHRTLIKSCLDYNLSLFAAHLPLDAHPVHGNAALLCDLLELSDREPFAEFLGKPVGIKGTNGKKLMRTEINERLQTLPDAKAAWKTFEFGPAVPERIGIVTGAGGDAVFSMQAEGIDTLITGEPKQLIFHYAKDRGLNVICAGHYATETVGVRAIGDLLAKKFSVKTQFIDCPVGV